MTDSQGVRTRFAPSPTGYLHIGGARTALFNWLFARHNKGKFILRVEDTDVERSTLESTKAILDGMEWLGLIADEGPFFQSERFDIYKEHAKKLLEKSLAYRCWCAPQELEQRRNEALKHGRPPKYDGRCKNKTDSPDAPNQASSTPYAIRFIVPPGVTMVRDVIKGSISFNNDEIEDLVILRSDGTPTYNLCVVVDDATMNVTHVIRGDDHLTNTPKQILLYEALGLKPPIFAHLPMILGPDKTRLSKRHGATSVMAYKEMGYMPNALLNYLARLGWSHGDEEIFSIEELIEKFSLEHVGKSSGVFNPEKLLWLNHHYIKETKVEELSSLVLPFLKECGVDAKGDERLPLIIATIKERAKTLKEMAEQTAFYFKDKITYDEKAVRKFFTLEAAEVFTLLKQELEAITPFTHDTIAESFNKIVTLKGIKLGSLAQPVRVALTGATISPGIFETIEAMGKDMTVKRLENAIGFINNPLTPFSKGE